MDRDPGDVLEELERQWDLSQEAAEAALEDWDQQELDSEEYSGLIDTVIETQRQQRDKYLAVKSHKQRFGL